MFDVSHVPEHITRELPPGETLLWWGQPKGGFRWYPSDIYTTPFFLLWLCGASFIAYTAWSSRFIPIFMKLFFLIFVAIGIALNLRKFMDKWNREHTWYGLTDRSVIIVTDFLGLCVNRFPLKDLGEVRIVPFDDTRGTITFGLERSRFFRSSMQSWNFRLPVKLPFMTGESNAHLSFDGIEGAESVYYLMNEAWRKLLDPNSVASFPDMPAAGVGDRRPNPLKAVIAIAVSVFFAWQMVTVMGKGMFEFFRDFNAHSHPAPRDACAEWREGLKAQELVAQARARHPDYPGLSAQETHRKGLEHDRRGEVADAICAWECEVAKNPQSLDGWNDIGYAYQRLNNPELALENAGKATAIDPHFGHGHYTAARALVVMGRYPEAASELEMASRDGWEQAGDTQMLLGLALRGQGDETGATAAFRRALEIRPKHPEASKYLAGEKFTPNWASCRESLAVRPKGGE